MDITPNATPQEIKKAYRKLSMKYHPDKNNNDDTMFKKINMANEILSNDVKKKNYDLYGIDGVKNSLSSDGFAFDDIFADILSNSGLKTHLESMFGGGGGGSMFGGMFGGGGGGGMFGEFQQLHKQNQQCVVYNIDVTLEHLFKGYIKKLKISNDVKCNECTGVGSILPEGIINCTICNGHGVVTQLRQYGLGMMVQTASPCTTCKRTGTIIKPEFKCKLCDGLGNVSKSEIIQIVITPGMKAGEKITIPDSSGNPKLIVILNLLTHPVYTVSENDIILEKEISLKEALLGYTFDLDYLDGEIYSITNNGIYNTNKPYNEIKNLGFGTHDTRGSLKVHIKVKYPMELSTSVKNTLANIEF
jgi:DnaJ-class molecular chaperone